MRGLTADDLALAARHLGRADPVMAEIVRRVGPCRFRATPRATAFAALAESIVYQQISGKAASAIHGRLVRLAGGRLHPAAVLGATEAALRGCGLSRQKVAFLRDLAARADNGLPRRFATLSDEAVVDVLTAVKGIGPWTAEMFLMFRLGRPDVLPVSDYGIRKAMQRAWRMRDLPRPDRMRRLAEPWRPYRTIACWYLWRSLEG